MRFCPDHHPASINSQETFLFHVVVAARSGRAVLAYAAGVPKVIIDVMLKPEIHDPQGDAIASACRRLGFDQVAGVRQGKRFEIELAGPASAEELAKIAADLLANPVIETYTVQTAHG
jgi:phosphoribosylformylglycinamidine synthase subunit PurS